MTRAVCCWKTERGERITVKEGYKGESKSDNDQTKHNSVALEIRWQICFAFSYMSLLDYSSGTGDNNDQCDSCLDIHYIAISG